VIIRNHLLPLIVNLHIFLHPSDLSGAIITVIKFDGKNYDLWEQAVQTALITKNKLSFIDGTITEPTDRSSAEAKAWAM